MDSIELNKIAAAVVCAAALVGGCVLAARLAVPDAAPERTEVPIPGLQRLAPRPAAVAAAAAPAANTASPPAAAPLPAAAAAARGERLANAQCGGCHSLDPNGGVRVGPPLFGIGGAVVASNAAFTRYSPALRALGGTWTAARLDRWLLNPAAMAPGTAMGFSGIADPAARADVVAFLMRTGAADGKNGR